MSEMRVVSPAPHVGTTSPHPLPAAPIGFPALNVLASHSLIMDGGPTGASHYWPELFSVVHPALATTDVSLNHVDEVWLSPAGQTMLIVLSPAEVQAPAVSEVVAEIRDLSGLAVNDVAAMLGLRRRQFYNLLDNGTTTSERERWIHALRGVLGELNDAANGQTDRVRAALLRPDDGGTSLFDLVVGHDEAAARARAGELCDALREGRMSGKVQRSSPRLKRLGASASAASDFLSGYRDRDSE